MSSRNIGAVQLILAEDLLVHYIQQSQVASLVDISLVRVHEILTKYLELSQAWPRWAPHPSVPSDQRAKGPTGKLQRPFETTQKC